MFKAFYSNTVKALLLTLVGAYSVTVYASMKDDVGYTELANQLGAALPDGSGISVFQIEAGDDWIADSANAEFSGKTITSLSSVASPSTSNHATTVGKLFYGSSSSMSPGITDIGAHSVAGSSTTAAGWLFDHLQLNTAALPLETNRRIANHSWVDTGSVDGATASIVFRFSDWYSNIDEVIQIYAPNNGSTDRVLMASSFNGIVVGRTDGVHATGVIALDSVYVAGRPAIHLVAPASVTSSSAPIGASAAALLISAAQLNPAWSDSSTSNRLGTSIANAERLETIKAALMAGASRITYNTSGLGDITTYRESPSDQTANGLDWRYGAGQINVAHSYAILAAGEKPSVEDGGASNIGFTGFDHDPAFGGSSGSNNTATYELGTTDIPIDLSVSLVWNLNVSGSPNTPVPYSSTTLYDLDLELINTSNGSTVAAESISSIDNTENIWLTLEANTQYQLRVKNAPGQANFNWDYSLAWAQSPATTFINVPLPAWAVLLLFMGFAAIYRRHRPQH